ncbi:MAG: hypothetical protein NTY38_04895, partial [Acidobacteria bacterium]|nr:hypothetical protein [Acidobacteriota bacterium]
APTSSTPMPAAGDRPLLRRPEAAATPAQAGTTEIPAGTAFVVRLVDGVDSERDSVGQSYRATLDEAIVVGGNTVIPRGADAVVKLVDDQESGKLAGRTILTLDLMQVIVNGRPLAVDTQEATAQSESRTGRSGKVVGGRLDRRRREGRGDWSRFRSRGGRSGPGDHQGPAGEDSA